jgi:hypothetical protein
VPSPISPIPVPASHTPALSGQFGPSNYPTMQQAPFASTYHASSQGPQLLQPFSHTSDFNSQMQASLQGAGTTHHYSSPTLPHQSSSRTPYRPLSPTQTRPVQSAQAPNSSAYRQAQHQDPTHNQIMEASLSYKWPHTSEQVPLQNLSRYEDSALYGWDGRK